MTESTVLVLSDLGPQIGYRTVFLIEYLGPIIIMAAYSSRPAFIYGAAAAAAPWTLAAQLGVGAWIGHFVKRELETVFVHKFSRPTMPLTNLFKNCFYYYAFALAVGYPLCHPLFTAPAAWSQVLLGGGIMAASELVNLAVHLQLSSMRPAEGSTKRDTPGGPLFALVSCPNYTAEVLSWVGFSIMTQVRSGRWCGAEWPLGCRSSPVCRSRAQRTHRHVFHPSLPIPSSDRRRLRLHRAGLCTDGAVGPRQAPRLHQGG